MELLSAFSHMTVGYMAGQIVIGILLGTLIGMTSIGAGILVLPVLLLISHVEPAAAIGSSLLFGLLSKGFGVVQYWQKSLISWQITRWVLLGMLPAVWLSSYAVNHLGAVIDKTEFDSLMRVFITVVMFFIAIYLSISAFKKDKGGTSKEQRVVQGKEKVAGVLTGIITGTIQGFTSIGGSILIVSSLAGYFQLPAKLVVGSTMFIATASGLVASSVYLLNGNINFPVTMLLLAGSLVGVRVGVQLATTMPNHLLKKIIAAVVIFSFLNMLV